MALTKVSSGVMEGGLNLSPSAPDNTLVTTSAGNVGIGTATPAEPLHLFSSIAQSTVGASDIIRLAGQGTDNTVGNRLEVGFNYSSANRQNFATIGFVTTSTAGFCNGDLYFATRSVTTDTAPVEQARITSTGLFQFNSGYGSVATAYGCRAWVNFNGTGTVAIRASGNVSSISDFGTGNYGVNYTTSMPNANYAVTAGYFLSTDTPQVLQVREYFTNYCTVIISQPGIANYDSAFVSVVVHR